MTDHLTDELVVTCLPAARRVRFPISRLVVDPERFMNDADEPMSRVGMGVIYEQTSHGRLLRLPPTPAARQHLLERYYLPHHAALEAAVATELERYGRCTILDMHSFPSSPLPYELDQDPDRADICIGTDEFHTPKALTDEIAGCFSADGLSVAINRPFSGAVVPMRHFRKDRRVTSIMLEVNRRLYLDEATGQQGKHFSSIQNVLAKILNTLAGYVGGPRGDV